MKVEIEMIMPHMPNYIKAKDVDLSIDVGEFSDIELKNFIVKWQDSFLAHAKKRKELLEQRKDGE